MTDIKSKAARMGTGCLVFVKQTAGGDEFSAVIEKVTAEGVSLRTCKLDVSRFFKYEDLEYIL